MKKIKLTQGKYTIVDDEAFEYLNKFKWCLHSTGYAVRNLPRDNKPRKQVLMHRIIIGDIPGLEVDHIDGNRLNNQKNNLRICNRLQNSLNRKRQSNNKSGFKGVSFHKGKFRSVIQINKQYIHLGSFGNKIDAFKKYKEAAKMLHGEFANF